MSPLPPLLEQNAIRLTTAAAVLAAVLGTVIAETRYRTHLARDMEEIKQTLHALRGEQPEAWSRRDMERWVRESQARNPDWSPAEVPWPRQR